MHILTNIIVVMHIRVKMETYAYYYCFDAYYYAYDCCFAYDCYDAQTHHIIVMMHILMRIIVVVIRLL